MAAKEKKLSQNIGAVSKPAEPLFESLIQKNVNDSITSFEDAISEENPRKRADYLDRIFRANLGRMTTGLSPAALLIAFTDWVAQLSLSPNRRLELLRYGWEKWFKLFTNCLEYLLKRDPCCFEITDKRFKSRFTEEHWQKWPYCLVAQTYLSLENCWEEATSIRGVAKDHKELVSFIGYQWLNAFSPENNFFINPRFWEKTWESKGKNFIDGWNNWQSDFWEYFANEKKANTEEFIVGKNVAITPGKVIYQNDLIELIQYEPQTETVYPEPVLIVPAWIMKYYILDLSPHNSMVNYLVKKGHTVFMISWKNPDASYRDYRFVDYLKGGVIAALDAVSAITNGKKVHATGYCIGGTILSIAASYLLRKDDNRLKTITLFAAQTDFEEAGELMTFIDENQLSYLEDIMFSQGYLRGDQMSSTFELLRPKELIWSVITQRYLLGEREKLTDLLAWNKDTTRLPYKMHSEYLRDMHLNNDLIEGEYTIDGKPITIDDIKQPMFVVATEKDHIAPWKSVYKIHLYCNSTEITFVLANKGHNGGIISEPGHPKRSFRIGKKKQSAPYKAPDTWFKDHKPQKGSWWPVWHEWLAEKSGKKIAPPTMGAPRKGYPVICDAPGKYVKET
ncbi:putative Poly-beta-hydroxybutyrate polymerase (plasmid) [Legionella adelaidensis]|uniref:Polyhydroxyalkanoic synthase n=1 Tax=Legionella adelaidensis TaxID=45056 RepID=A0A0W0R5F6_9GAMM|nr:alpha/beta fold hydrolase [Legionella adelaidensis]KTC66307.1 polyhydroxyalkanoic synthase [Legionella adelaidensis]VEH84903.1 putative Poly-beta-hydroxybutyrate polymerase [Legionella adelaidensis]